MPIGPIHLFLRDDHERLAQLLDASTRGATIDLEAFHAFRGGLLRHIGIEEKILFPVAKRLGDAEVERVTRQLRLDHAALAALLVPTPTRALVERLRGLLAPHNELEEGDDGVYARCERAAGAHGAAILERMRNAPDVKQAPYQDGPRGFASIERLLRAAGR
jgi:hypothetical protein